ncbi:uncharacterized protein BP01DRAFT_308422, partial [Aspergillus saccharolyticus JOP 1030-1]
CEERNDFTGFVILRKLDRAGRPLMHLNFPTHATPVQSIEEVPTKDQASLNLPLGSVGILRASHHAFELSKSIHPQFLFHPHRSQEKVSPGEIVKLAIKIWAMGIDFDAGESVSVQVSDAQRSTVTALM